MASSLFRGHDNPTLVSQWFVLISSQTVVMASCSGQIWNDRCTPSRGPFGALSFAAVSLYHRVCFAGAIYSRGLVETYVKNGGRGATGHSSWIPHPSSLSLPHTHLMHHVFAVMLAHSISDLLLSCDEQASSSQRSLRSAASMSSYGEAYAKTHKSKDDHSPT